MGPGTWTDCALVGSRRWRLGVLWLVTGLALAAAALSPRLAQDPDYHLFADCRALGAIPSAANVLSNLAFVAAGLAGLLASRRDPDEASPGPTRAAWLVFFGAVTLVGPGSALYHLSPSNDSLLWDRLPMAAAFAALFVAILAERVALAAARSLWPLVVASVGTVLYWWGSERLGAGDLRPYAVAQFLPLVAVPLVVALFPDRRDPGTWWVLGAALYGAAKLFELGDAALFGAGGLVSGHTVKHLLAAGAVGALAWRTAHRGGGERDHARALGPRRGPEHRPA